MASGFNNSLVSNLFMFKYSNKIYEKIRYEKGREKMKRKLIVIGLIMLLLTTVSIPSSIGVGVIRFKNHKEYKPLTLSKKRVIGCMPVITPTGERETYVVQINCDFEDEEEENRFYQYIDNVKEKIQNDYNKGDESKIKVILTNVDKYHDAIGGNKAVFKSDVAESVKGYFNTIEIFNSEFIELKDSNGNDLEIDYETIADIMTQDPSPMGIFSGRTVTWFGIIATAGLAERTKVWTFKGMISPEIFKGIAIFPIHTEYAWGATLIYRPPLKIKGDGGGHILKTWGFAGFYIALGRDMPLNYVQGVTVCMGGFVRNVMKNVF